MPRNFCGVTDENLKYPKIIGVWWTILSGHLPNRSLEHYRYSNLPHSNGQTPCTTETARSVSLQISGEKYNTSGGFDSRAVGSRLQYKTYAYFSDVLVAIVTASRSCVTPVRPWATCPICHLTEQLYLPAAILPPPQKSPPLLQVTGRSTKVGRLLSLNPCCSVFSCCLIL